MKQASLRWILSLSLSFPAAPVIGQTIYQWNDAQGRIHFSNVPVYEAKPVDEELPPATSFGGTQESDYFQTRSTIEQPSDFLRASPSDSLENKMEVENKGEPENFEREESETQIPESENDPILLSESEEEESDQSISDLKDADEEDSEDANESDEADESDNDEESNEDESEEDL